MSDPSPQAPSPLVSALVGGVAGGVLTGLFVHAANRRLASQLDLEAERLGRIELERLGTERRRLGLTRQTLQNQETDRAYQKAVLWLAHSNNDERLEYLVDQASTLLAGDYADHLIAQTVLRSPISVQIGNLVQVRTQLKQEKGRLDDLLRQTAELRKHRLDTANTLLASLLLGIGLFVPLYTAFDFSISSYIALYVTLLLPLSLWIPRFQRLPPHYLQQHQSLVVENNLLMQLSRLELLSLLRASQLEKLRAELLGQHAALTRTFAERQAEWLATAGDCVAELRPALETYQRHYPPRVRCDLSLIQDAALLDRLSRPLETAFAERLAELIRI